METLSIEPNTMEKMLLQRSASAQRPINGSLELLPLCNMSCDMCYVRLSHAETEMKGGLHTANEWISLGREMQKAGVLFLLLTGGEPLLFPDFKKLYSELKQMGMVLTINTNGTLLDEEWADFFGENKPRRINITLYGASPETYRQICGHGDGYERVISAILKLKKVGIPVVINASMIPENASDMGKILNFGKVHDIPVRMSTYMFPPVRRRPEESDSRFTPEEAAEMYVRKLRTQLSEEEYRNALEKQLKSTEKKEEEAENWGYHDEYMKCRAGRSAFWVSWDGTMSACGMTPFPVQVMPFQKPFHDCWMELTDRVRTVTVLKECVSCPGRSICNPCVAMLYSETGDVNRKALYLCEMTERIISKMKAERRGYNG